MTTPFEERERAAEALFAHEEEMRFRALVRRNRIIGTWMSARLGLSEAEGEAYTRRLVETIASPLTDAALKERLRGELGERGLDAAAAEVPDLFARAQAEAARAVREEDRAV
ncbi:protein of unknown function DUF1476 [Methylobacterium sp. 4-46]|uniref:DUF1476 domain-containing protein n=1 Tax=unclassified Methylobacterium TaxID=2615210 RepID=UPI000152D90F|nr:MULTISPECIES: DUF1476 domain-containing protein [Methylobacterium]ACA20506.1 protein of unknown function DUF1476 [Methylobacterium sp. 4-46]WFT79671.1 DUF1476 domain-containing protein [Methylobacterium nodulans]